MRYLNKIIFINSAHIPYAEVKLDGNVHFIGTQGVGKSTLLRALLFFYNADKLRLGIPKEKKSFDAFYFPYSNSYIIYEVMRENGAYSVVALKSQGRVMFRFIDAPFDSRWFIDEHRQVYGEWIKVREQVGTKHHISALVSSYEMYRDIIFGNNRRQELLPYRKYSIVDSSKYQNIPRTIQNVFLNTKLDADFIKDTIIRSMSDDDTSIDLGFYREQIKEFEQEYKDVALWSVKNKKGENIVSRKAEKVIDDYRALLDKRRCIAVGRKELNYAARMAQELLPQIDVSIQNSRAECDRMQRLRSEEQSKFNKERDKLTLEIGGLDSQLKKTAEKRKYYQSINIASILQRVEQETVVEHELERQIALRRVYEKNYANVMDRYKALADKIDLDLQGFITDKQICINRYTEDFIAKRELLMQELRKAETELRAVYSQKADTIDNTIGQLMAEENGVKIQKAKVGHENPFANEMAANEEERVDLQSRRSKTQAQVRETTLQIESLRQEALKEQEIAELKFEASLKDMRKEKADIEAKIEELNSLLEKSKGSFSEWLDQHKPGWQDNIGKVVDETAILYNDMLNPQLCPEPHPSASDKHSIDRTLYGVSIDLAAVERKFRTPEELTKDKQKQEALRSDCINRLNTMLTQHGVEMDSLSAKRRQQIRKLNDTLHELNAQLSIMPQEEKRIMRQTLEISKRLEDWHRQQLDKLEAQQNGIVAQRVRSEEAKKRVEAELERRLKGLQTDYTRQMKTEKAQVDALIQEAKLHIEEKRRQTEQRKEELRQAQYKELQGKGMDTTALDNYNRRIDKLTAEQAFIREHRDTVAWYRKDKEELFDQENAVKQDRKQKEEKLSLIENKYIQRNEKLVAKLSVAQDALRKQQTDKKQMEDGLEAVRTFRSDDTLCPLGSDDGEEKATARDCLAIVDELKREIYDELRSLTAFKRGAQDFLGMFSAHNTFHFNVSPVNDEEFFAFAANLAEFIDNDKISEYQKRISGRYTDIILRISKEVGDLTRSEGDITKTINDINRDFQERNFAGVIREIALRPTKTNDRLMLLLLSIKDFADNNLYDMGEMDLFATASRQDVNAKAVKFLLEFMKGLLDEPHRKLLQVADTFKLEFRIKENDNDTGWVEKIANVGSDGTDILVKAMVNIMLINVFKEKASKKSGDFKIHCMMDEIGKLHPNNVKGILDFANRRNILLVNSSPTTYNVEDYKYTYLLSKDGRANTKVVQLIKKL